MYKHQPIQFLLNKKIPIQKIFIRNKELPICSKCTHFIEHTNNYPYDPVPRDDQYGRCKKFGEMNIITGVIENDLASKCRLNDSKCGKFGEEYTEKIESYNQPKKK
jgi:hypothetical protein